MLPAAASLQKQGAGRAPLVSFLISTPETGVDSVALTYGLMGPVMAVVRPVVAVVTALVAGIASIGIREDETDRHPLPDTVGDDGACAEEGTGQETCDETCAPDEAAPSRARRFLHSLEYGFTSVLDDIALSLVVGMLLTGVLAGLLPDNFFDGVLGWGSGIIPMLAMIVLGLPFVPLRQRVHPHRRGAHGQGALSRRGAGVPAGGTGHQPRHHDRGGPAPGPPSFGRPTSAPSYW